MSKKSCEAVAADVDVAAVGVMLVLASKFFNKINRCVQFLASGYTLSQ